MQRWPIMIKVPIGKKNKKQKTRNLTWSKLHSGKWILKLFGNLENDVLCHRGKILLRSSLMFIISPEPRQERQA